METAEPGPEPEPSKRYPPYLRLAWTNPNLPRVPRPRVNFAIAIERHLAGVDGLTTEQFLAVYSGRFRPRPGPLLAPLIS